ncbi:MAG: hypothetical protein R3C01_02120 [Planctomycetaceae bacterium]
MLLLRQSTETCDGDYVEPPEDLLRIITMKEHPLAVVLAQWNAVEGHPMKDFKESVVGCWTVGRWAGDPVYMIGDYDESGLYEESKSYRNITRDLVEQWNRFVQLPSHELSYDPCESCG